MLAENDVCRSRQRRDADTRKHSLATIPNREQGQDFSRIYPSVTGTASFVSCGDGKDLLRL
jgi:hypothetical protein